MPELPEVEMYRRYFDQTALDQKISEIEILHPKVLGGQDLEFRQALVGDEFRKSRRWGKNLFLQTKKNRNVYMHFGMTGNLDYYNDSVEAPKYSRVVFSFESGYNLAYVSKRMFGRVGLAIDIDQYVANKSLGNDALEISAKDFSMALSNKKKNVKGGLLDQSVAAGIGNWIADEILFHARIHPTSSIRNLDDVQLGELYQRMKEIMQVAIEVEAVREELPPHYITRYGRKTSITCPHCKNQIDKTEVGGRGTYACSHCQVVY